MFSTERPDAWEVQGRGELQLAILVEMMRREGFELTVGKPEVVTKEIDGKLHEPTEYLTIDIPEEYVGPVTQLLGSRKGRLESMTNNASGWVRLEYIVAARALIGFRTEFLTETRGTGLLHHVFENYEPWMGDLRTRMTGSVVSDRSGVATTYAIAPLQERTSLLISPGTDVYEGMIIGENSRLEDMNVNITKEKKMTNVRAAASDDTIRLTPPRIFSLEQALEFIAADECIEVTPETIRMRKTILGITDRARDAKRLKSENQ
jgi:GTP-binding protein